MKPNWPASSRGATAGAHQAWRPFGVHRQAGPALAPQGLEHGRAVARVLNQHRLGPASGAQGGEAVEQESDGVR